MLFKRTFLFLFVLFFAQAMQAQTPAPAAFDINITNCPTAYPNSGDAFIVDFTVTNTGGTPSDPTPLYFEQLGDDITQNEPTVKILGTVNLPSIGVGETYSLSKNFGPIASMPRFHAFNNTIWSDFALRVWYPALSASGQWFESTFDPACKKFNSGLQVEVTADSYLIDPSGHLEYDITVTNTGEEQAANVMVYVAPGEMSKNVITLSNQPAGSQVFVVKPASKDVFLRLPLLAAGTSETFHVNVDIAGDIDSIFDPNVYVYSAHQLNGGNHYDINDAVFYRDAPGGCSAIDGFTKLGEFNGHGYYMSDGLVPWTQAKTLAENAGGYLVTMNDQAENDFVKANLNNTMVFIGYNDATNEGVGQWANNEPVALDLSYANSATNDYAVMNFWAGTWQMEQAGPYRKFVMEMDCGGAPNGDLTITCPQDIVVNTNSTSEAISWVSAVATTTCASGTNTTVTQTAGAAPGSSFTVGTHTISYNATDLCGNSQDCSFTITVNSLNNTGCGSISGYTKLGEFNGHGYYMSDALVPWTLAKTLAENAGGYLVTMNDQAENDFVKANLNSTMVFIGYNDATTEGVGQWVNNEPVALDLSYGNSATNDYAVMNFWAGTWQLEQAGPYRKFVMEMDCGTTGGSQPDLTISNLNLSSASGQAGDVVSVSFDLNNVGAAAVVGDYEIRLTVFHDGPFTGVSYNVGSLTVSNTTIGTTPMTTTFVVPNIADGAYTFGVEADGGEVIVESNEYNNSALTPFDVTSMTGGGCGSINGFTKLGEYNGHGYYLSDASENWAQAKTQAENAGGYLVTMNDQAENDFVQANLGSELVLIGYNDAATEGVGSWATTEPVTLDLSYGNTSENDYAVMNFWAGTWQMVNQWVAKKYVMEMNCATPQPASIARSLSVAKAVNIHDVYPNPAIDNITIRVIAPEDKSSQFNVYDGRGQLLLSEKRDLPQGASEVEFDLSNLPAGMYFVKEAGASQYYHFVIMR